MAFLNRLVEGATILKVKGNSCRAQKTKRVGITNLENARSRASESAQRSVFSTKQIVGEIQGSEHIQRTPDDVD